MTQPDGGKSQPSAAYRPLVAVSSALLVLLVVLVPLTASAQDDVDRVDALNAEREELHLQSLEAAEEVDVATASIEEVSAALDEINGLVQLQTIRVQDAERVVEAAQLEADSAIARLGDVETEIVAARQLISEIAITSFTGESASFSDDLTELALSEDPGEAARFRHLLELQTGSLSDALDRLRRLEVEAVELVAVRDEAGAPSKARVPVAGRPPGDPAPGQEREGLPPRGRAAPA